MKVLISIQGLMPWCGGSAISEASLCTSLAKHCEVVFMCRKGAVDYAYARSFGIKHIHEYDPQEAFEAWKNNKHWLNELFSGLDICHLNGHWRWEDPFFARICRRWNVPYVLQPRGMLLIGHRRVLLKKIYNHTIGNWLVKNAARLIALSNFEVSQFEPYGYPKERVVVIPNGIPVLDETVFVPSRELERLWGVSKEYFLYFGRLEARKNLLFLAEVFSNYVKQGGKSHLFFVGPSERGYEDVLKEKIDSLGMEGKIHVQPPFYDNDKWALVHGSRGLIYPTLQEPFGRVPFEAVSASTFPIVPDESGSAEYLRPFLPFCVYRNENADSLLETMKQVERRWLSQDFGELRRAKQWVNTELDWMNLAKRFMALYEEVIGSKHRFPSTFVQNKTLRRT